MIKASTCCSDHVLSSNTETRFWIRVFVGTDHQKLAIRSLFFFFKTLSMATFHISKSQHGSAEHKRLCSCRGKPSVICPASVLHLNRPQVSVWGHISVISSNLIFIFYFFLQLMEMTGLNHPVPTSLKAWPLNPPVCCYCGWGHPTTNMASLWSFPSLSAFYMSFFEPPSGPHPPTAHFQPSARSASVDQSQEAACRS